VKRLTATNEYDFAVIDHPQMGWLVRSVLDPRIPIVFVAHNIEQEMYEERAQAHHNLLGRLLLRREARLIKGMEHWLARSAVEVWTLTAHDAAHFKRVAPATKVREMQIPGSAKPRRSAGKKTIDIALIGSWSWAANREALDWFLDNVRPKIPHGVSIHIAGKGAEHLHGKYLNVHYAGFVPDSIAFLQSARVVAIPTLTGGGIQIKTLDAIASGSRIVATACAVRGLAQLPPTVRVVKDAQSFARELVWATGSSEPLTHWGEAITWCMERERKFGEQIRAACTSLCLGKMAA
jgi:hypothetical protein